MGGRMSDFRIAETMRDGAPCDSAPVCGMCEGWHSVDSLTGVCADCLAPRIKGTVAQIADAAADCIRATSDEACWLFREAS